MDDIDRQIQLHQERAELKHRQRQNWLKACAASEQKSSELQERARPIVEPIVKAIERGTEKTTTPPLGVDRLRSLMQDLGPFPDSRGFKRYVAEVYENPQLFNVMLSLVRLGVIQDVPIKKMNKHGLVESLIFYGQGKTNLDELSAYAINLPFKQRMEEFDEFYRTNLSALKEATNSYSDNNSEDEASDEAEDSEIEDGDDGSDNGADFFLTIKHDIC